MCLIDKRDGQTCKEDLFGFTYETGLFIYEELVHSISTLWLDYFWNQHKSFRQSSANVANIKTYYNEPRYYAAKLSNFISSIRSPMQMKLEEMSNNKTAVFSNWLTSTSYAPFIAFPKTHDLPSYLKDSIEMNQDLEWFYPAKIEIVKNCLISNTF